MDRCICFCMLLLAGVTLNAQTPINVRGTVTNQKGEPVQDAIVTLVKQELKDTTGEDGKFSFIKDTVAVISPIIPQSERVTFKRGVLEFRATGTSTANIEFFDLNGSLLKKVSIKNTTPGIHRLNIEDYFHSVNMMVIRASIGQYKTTFQYMPLQKGKYALSQSLHHNKSTDKAIAVTIATDIDSIKVKADGYQEKAVIISTYDTLVDITLDTIADEEICEGCGKTDYPKSGKYTIDVEGQSREYILKIPNNYDPNKQYKLIFCIHAWGGSMDQVANGGYYGLERLSNGSAIFVSPNGLPYQGSQGWENPKGRDIKFFKAMIKHFNSNFCIDQKRIFSTGFSFGGMMSYAIGCNMANVFRAIAPMSGSFISGCDSTDNKDPIAVWMAHGTNDDIVPLSTGKTALKHFIAKNGCSNETVPVNPSPCVAYQGCKEGYPVIYCEFNGDHAPQSWAQQATWDFFSQF